MAEPSWQRLPAQALAGFGVRALVAVAAQSWQGLIPLAAAVGFSDSEALQTVLLAGLGGLLLIAVTIALLTYRNFGWWDTGERILVRQGVINRKQLSLPFERVQAVHLREPLYLRPFGLVDARLESAGSTAQEVRLPGIPLRIAEALRGRVLAERGQAASSTPSDPVAAPVDAPPPLIRLSVGDLVRHGLASPQALILLGAIFGLAGSLGQMDTLMRQVANAIETLADRAGGLGAAGVIVLLNLGVVLVSVLISVLLTVLQYYGFRLIRTADGYEMQHGLLEKQSRSLKAAKIQCLKLAQFPAERLLRRWRAIVVQAGERKWASSTAQLPGLSGRARDLFLADVYPGVALDRIAWHRVDRGYIGILALRWTALLGFGLLAVIWPIGVWALAGLALLLPIWLLCRRAWAARRHAMVFDTETPMGLARKGLFAPTILCFPLYKVQTVALTQNPLQRRRGTASLTLKLAGEAIRLPHLPLDQARYWRDRALYEAETGTRPWM